METPTFYDNDQTSPGVQWTCIGLVYQVNSALSQKGSIGRGKGDTPHRKNDHDKPKSAKNKVDEEKSVETMI